MSQATIHVVGAGLGGLTLARCLQRRGLSAIVYEKATSSPRHFYGITLYRKTYLPLLDELGLDELGFRRHVAIDADRDGDGSMRSDLLVSKDVQPGSFRASRSKLETLLREGLTVQWDQAVNKVDTAHGKPIRVHMSNGQEILADTLVGADGPHSRVRSSLIPQVQPRVLPFVAINGKRKISHALYQQIFEPALQGQTVMEMKKGQAILNLQIAGFEKDHVYISWVYSRPARVEQDSLYSPERSSSEASNIPEDFYAEVQQLGQLSAVFEEVFNVNKLRQDRKLSWLMRTTAVDLSVLVEQAKKGVLLLGDAVHAQPILGGQGANAAIEDGISLAEHIGKHGLDSIPTWVESSHQRWQRGVEDSERSLAEMHKAPKATL